MTSPIGTTSLFAQWVALCVCVTVLLLEVGCVSQRTYERVKTETLEQTQALEAVRANLRELDREIAGLQESNRREDATVSQLRATIQREEEQLPIMRQRAEDTLSFLKTQVATLMNQSWHLARKIADIRQESASLQAKVAQYKEERERSLPSTVVASASNRPEVTQAAIVEPPLSTAPTSPSSASPPAAQANPTPPAPPVKPMAPSPSVKVEPSSTNDSWIGMIVNWLSALWKWLIS